MFGENMFGENPFVPARPAEGERMAGMNQFGVFFSLILPALAAGAAAGATVMAALFKRMMARERRERQRAAARRAAAAKAPGLEEVSCRKGWENLRLSA